MYKINLPGNIIAFVCINCVHIFRCVSDEARKKYDLTESNCATNEELNQRSTLIRTPLSTPSIMKFAKILTVEEREKAFGSSVVER